VRYIQKASEPLSFTEWKLQETEDWQPNWDNFGRPEKRFVHGALLQEQGYICCYCEIRISTRISHIEHFKPRSRYPELSLEYANLLASCQGEVEDPPPKPSHCGQLKGAWYDKHLLVSPLDPACADYFRYSGDGQVLPTHDLSKATAAITTIDKLGLNIDKLRRLRESAIEGVLDDKFDELTEIEKRKLIQYFDLPDENGQYQEFCSALIYQLKQNLPA
jgi:uncharacterized protein (TIGR02646 family)